MGNFFDNESLTDNLDDDLAGRVLTILEKIEELFPEELERQLHVVSLLNRFSTDELNMPLIRNVISRMEERYGQAQK